MNCLGGGSISEFFKDANFMCKRNYEFAREL
jgi:hypothetical protein